MKSPTIASLIALLGLSSRLTPAYAQATVQPSSYHHGPYMMGWYGGGYGMLLGPLFMMFALAIMVAVALLLIRWLTGPWRSLHTTHVRSALDILKERFARGEIDKDEYEQRRRVLGE